MLPRTPAPLSVRFERQWIPEPNSGCHLWLGTLTPGGYGQINRDGIGTKATASRVAWELHYGPIPSGMFICHKCDNRACVNPAHLFLGTPRDNSRDREIKGRSADQRGVSNHRGAKLTDETAMQVYLATGSQREIGARFGVNQKIVCDIKRKRGWSHIHGSAT